MTTIASGSSLTLTSPAKGMLYRLTSYGAVGKVTGAQTMEIGPAQTTYYVGPLDVGQSVTVTSRAGEIGVSFGYRDITDVGPNGLVHAQSDPTTGAVSLVSPDGNPLFGKYDEIERRFVGVYTCNSANNNISAGPVDSNGNWPMTIGAGTTAAEVWANANVATAKAAVNGVFTSGRVANLSTDLIIGAFTFQLPAQAALAFFAGSAPAGGGSATGLLFGVSSNTLRLYVSANGVLSAALQASTPTIAGDAADHKAFYVYDPVNRTYWVWVDGTLRLRRTDVVPAGTGACTTGMLYGSSSTTATAIAGQFKNITEIIVPGGTVPRNIVAVMTAHNADPTIDLLAQFAPTKALLTLVAGQSNDKGEGETNGSNNAEGLPINDPTFPNGETGRRSYWPTYANEVGKLGFSSNILNRGVGGAGLVASFVGCLRPWVLNIKVKRGSWCVYNGQIFKADISGHVTMPTSTVPPAVGTGADGIPWILVGPYSGQAYGVALPGSPFFDPNGLIAACVTSLSAAMAIVPSAAVAVHVGFGETDADQGTTRAEYRDALLSLCQHFNASAKITRIFLGFTLGSTSSVLRARYDSDLVPGVADAVAAGLTNVVAGVNLYREMGVLQNSPASGVGVKGDGLHGNDPAMDLGGRLHGRRHGTELRKVLALP